MAELSWKPATELTGDRKIGQATLSALTPEFITSIAPFDHAAKTIGAVMKSAHGMALPAQGRMTGKAALRCLWTSRGQYFLIGDAPADPALAPHAALSDQSAAWAGFRIAGADCEAVMARLTPIDLRAATFKRGHVARSDFSHMMAIIARSGAQQMDVYVMRSFAKTAEHHLVEAMKSVAARRNSEIVA